MIFFHWISSITPLEVVKVTSPFVKNPNIVHLRSWTAGETPAFVHQRLQTSSDVTNPARCFAANTQQISVNAQKKLSTSSSWMWEQTWVETLIFLFFSLPVSSASSGRFEELQRFVLFRQLWWIQCF